MSNTNKWELVRNPKTPDTVRIGPGIAITDEKHAPLIAAAPEMADFIGMVARLNADEGLSSDALAALQVLACKVLDKARKA